MPVQWVEGTVHFGQCDDCASGNMEFRVHAIPLDPRTNAHGTWQLCRSCAGNFDDNNMPEYDEDPPGDEEDHEESYSFGTDYVLPKMPDPRLILPALAARDPRLISIEQEVGLGGRHLAEALYNGGFAEQLSMLSYHSGDVSGFCKVEQDGSVDGEIIYSKLRLDEDSVARRLESALDLVRDAIKAGESKLDMRCGLHIHVDARGLGMAQVESLYHLWNHLEDTIFRLAAANWRCHRSLKASHDYSPRTTKGLSSRREIGRSMEEVRRALNLSPYLESRGYCRCGAFTYEDWANCACTLPKPTVEFRVFNATANLRKIHAYTALSLALVEMARHLTFTDEDHASFAFTRTEAIEDAESTKRALDVIFQRLPLTETEKEDLSYCAENSSVSEVFASM